MKKLVVLQTHPIQYYAPVYRELSARDNLNLVVIYLTDSGAREYFDPGFNRLVKWDIDLLAGYCSEVINPGLELADASFFDRSSSKLFGMLRAKKPDYILLYGYSSLMNWVAWCYARLAGAKMLYMSDSNVRTEAVGGIFQRMVKHLCVRSFFSGIYRFLYCSDANAQYLMKYGAPQKRMVWSPFAIEVRRFTQTDTGADREYDFIWIGKFIELKRVQDYLQSLENLKTSGTLFRALLVGDGPSKSLVSEVAEKLVQQGFLDVKGFANQSEVPALLGASSTLIFTSESESYGLMATEAAAAGCALIVADNIGCVGCRSSAQPGVNALCYKVADVAQLTACMHKILEDKALLASMQAAGIRIAKDHDLANAAMAIEKTVLDKDYEHA